MSEVRQFTVGADDDGVRVDRWFRRVLPGTSFNLVSRWARTGQLRVDGARVDPGDRLRTGQQVRVPPEPAAAPAGPTPRPRADLSPEQTAYAQDLVIHRDAQALVLNKPPGLATQGGTGTHTHVDMLLDALWFDGVSRPKLVHRLDKDTSGVLLIAQTARAAAFFSKAFQGRTATKLYWGLVMGLPDIDDMMIDLPLAKQPGSGGEKMHVDHAAGLPSRSRFRQIDHAADRAAWLEMQPLTGRTHQLRVHAASIGHPIVGDGKYGGRDAFLTGGVSRKLHLHARRLVIEHPDGGTIDIKAEPPEHFAESLAMLGFNAADGDLPLDVPRDDLGPPKRRRMSSATSGNRRGERRSRGSV